MEDTAKQNAAAGPAAPAPIHTYPNGLSMRRGSAEEEDRRIRETERDPAIAPWHAGLYMPAAAGAGVEVHSLIEPDEDAKKG